ncbi:MAG: isochorismatase family protein [Actinomycetes bacterium]
MPATSGAISPAAFGSVLGWGRSPALLVVDMMRAYFTPGSPFDLGDSAVPAACARLLAAARTGARPVVHTLVRYAEGGRDGGHFVRKVPGLLALAADADDPALGEELPELAPLPGEVVVVKQYASAFCGTSLAATLTSLGVDTVVVSGVSTSGCIRATATDALQHGFRPMVVAEACGDRLPEFHESNLRDLGAKYADVVSLDDACRELSG